MYYYILESPSSRSVRQNYQHLRDLLTNLGIAGEMVASSPARSPQELAIMGIQKGYSTIVAVGGDYHINQIAISLHDKAALGIVPINASEEIVQMVGGGDFRSAAQTLKYRRLTSTSLLLIEPETLVFLDCQINSIDKLAKVSLVIDNKAKAFAYFNTININRELELQIESEHLTEPRKVLGVFTVGGRVVKSHSHFHGKVVKIVTEPDLDITVARRKVSRTPVILRALPDALKVITRRGTLEQ